MASSDALVLGGGVAGLACASALAAGGVRVTLLEKKPRPGGRAYSFEDPATGETVDNGQHLFLGCYREARILLRRVGTENLLRLPRGVRVAYADAQGYKSLLRCPGRLPWPLHLGVGVLGLGGLSIPDKLSLLRLKRPDGALRPELDRMTVRQWLDSLGVARAAQERFLDPVALGALNEPPERASAIGFAQVLREAFCRDEESSRLGLPATGLNGLYAEPARRFIESRGGRVLTGYKVAALRAKGGRVAEAVTERGERFEAGWFVSTLPPWSLAAVERPRELDGAWTATKATPILGIHLWLDRPLVGEPVTGLLGADVHWIFDKTALWGREEEGQYLSLVISGAHALVSSAPKDLLALACRDLERCFPGFKKDTIRHWSVIKNPFATPSPVPGSDAARPAHAGPIANFLYAGDWTQTGLPATIEGAAKSGHACAGLILGPGE